MSAVGRCPFRSLPRANFLTIDRRTGPRRAAGDVWAFTDEVAYCSRSRPTQVGKRTPLPPRPHGMCPACCKSLDILRRVGSRAQPSRSRTRILLSRTDHAQSSFHDSQRLGSPPPAKDPRTRKLR